MLTKPAKKALSSSSENVVNCGLRVVVKIGKLAKRSFNVCRSVSGGGADVDVVVVVVGVVVGRGVVVVVVGLVAR